MEKAQELTEKEKHVSYIFKNNALWHEMEIQLLNACYRSHCELIHEYIYLFFAVPRAGPRNMRVFETTTSTISIGWDHAEGPVQQYKIAYAPLTGDPITEFVSKSIYLVIHSFNTFI